MAELITNKDGMSLASNAFTISQGSGNYNVMTTVINSVTVPAGYKNESAQIVIYAPQNSDSGSCYAFVVDNSIMVEDDVTIDSKSYRKLASGSCNLKVEGEVGAISNLKLGLQSNKPNLQFYNDQIVNITGTEGADTIYIVSYGTNGVSKTAELNFSQGGTDTIKFDGATTVQNISGGVRREYTYFSA